MEIPDSIWQALRTVYDLLKEETGWLIGGSCGLLLQQVSVGNTPRDLDLYVDRNFAEAIHRRLRAYSVDEPQWSETGMYRSYLSHYAVHDVQVELVGSLEVDTAGSHYLVEVAEWLYPHRPRSRSAGLPLPLMPLAHELIFNVLRQRPDRYEPISQVMRNGESGADRVLQGLIERNRLSEECLLTLSRLVPDGVRAGKDEER